VDSVTSADWSYTEYARLGESIKDDAKGLKEAAKHFESLFINMWLKSAREANMAIAKDGLFGGSEMQMQQQLHDSQMAMHMAKEGGIGLAAVIERQLAGGVAARGSSQAHSPSPSPSPSPEPLRTVTTHSAVTQVSADNVDPVASPVERVQSLVEQVFANPQEFIERLREPIQQIASKAGLPPVAVMAQAALETGWGAFVTQSSEGQSSHNLFGIKATDWDGPTVEVSSKEYRVGRWLNEVSQFRAYPDWAASIADYAKLITQSPRYSEAAASPDVAGYANALGRAGYATDPNYAEKIIRIAEQISEVLER